MTTERDDDRLPDSWLEAARGHHRPPATPREQMWTAIAAERARRKAVRIRWRRAGWGLAFAATLVLGIGLGRVFRVAGPRQATTAAAPAAPGVAYRLATAQYLARTEALLTDFHAASKGRGLDPQFLASARDLLTTTRLMLDSPDKKDPHLTALLQDLELVLAQIAQVPAESGERQSIEMINQGLTQRSVLSRLRAVTPAAGMPLALQGAL